MIFKNAKTGVYDTYIHRFFCGPQEHKNEQACALEGNSSKVPVYSMLPGGMVAVRCAISRGFGLELDM